MSITLFKMLHPRLSFMEFNHKIIKRLVNRVVNYDFHLSHILAKVDNYCQTFETQTLSLIFCNILVNCLF